MRYELTRAQSEHIVLGVHIYTNCIFIGDFVIVLISVTIPSQYEVDVIPSNYNRLGSIGSVAVSLQGTMVSTVILERNAHRILAIATIAVIKPVPRNLDEVVELASFIPSSIHYRSFNSASAVEGKCVECNLSTRNILTKHG